MARVLFNNPLTAIRGKLDGVLFRQQNDDTSMMDMAHNSRQPRNHQNEHATGFHPLYEELARATHKTAYNIALSDRMMPPVIHRMMMRGDSILVQASDNVMVAKVEVQVLGEQGDVLEQGDAVRLKGDWWEYIPSYAGMKITAAAWDLAGNVTKAEM